MSYCERCMTPAGASGCPHKVEPRDRSRRVFCNNEHIAIEWTNPGVCPLCASHAEMGRLRTAAEKLHAFVNAKGQGHEENALGRTNTQSKTYDEERALVCWQILDEIEALFQGAKERANDGGVKHTVDSSGKRRWLANEIQRLCDRVTWCQASRTSGDLDADLDALEEQRAVVESLLQETTING